MGKAQVSLLAARQAMILVATSCCRLEVAMCSMTVLPLTQLLAQSQSCRTSRFLLFGYALAALILAEPGYVASGLDDPGPGDVLVG
jgi:hypothetical protein